MKRSYYKFIVPLIILIVGVLIWMQQGGERPPSLSLSSESMQGFFDNDSFFFSFDQNDMARIQDYKDAEQRTKGIQYFYSESNITFDEIISSIKPDLANQCMVISYIAGPDKFHIYPKGPFANTVLLNKSDLRTFELPAAHSFVIVCKKDYETINVKHASEPPANFNKSFDNYTPGWHLTAFSSNQQLQDVTFACYNRLESIWPQNGDNSFKNTSLNSPSLEPGYYLAWLQLSGSAGSCKSKDSSNNRDGSDSSGSGGDGGASRDGGGDGDTMSIYQHLKQNYLIEQSRLHDRD